MANVKFTVRRMDEDSPQTISVTFRFGRNDKLMYATPLKVEPIFWDADRQKVKNSKYCRHIVKARHVHCRLGEGR